MRLLRWLSRLGIKIHEVVVFLLFLDFARMLFHFIPLQPPLYVYMLLFWN
jgi:hypothetical protein